MQITGDLNDEYFIMSMISRHEKRLDSVELRGFAAEFIEKNENRLTILENSKL